VLEHVYFNLTNAMFAMFCFEICWWLFECSLHRNVLHTSLPLPALTR
jgi:hypothetical protein